MDADLPLLFAFPTSPKMGSGTERQSMVLNPQGFSEIEFALLHQTEIQIQWPGRCEYVE